MLANFSAVSCMLAFTSCAMVRSLPVVNDKHLSVGCKSALGSYALPKRKLHIKVTKTGDNYSMHKIDAIAYVDNDHIYCLDHWYNPLASDTIKVFKTKIEVADVDNSKVTEGNKAKTGTEKNTPFLQLIASKAVDETAGIIRKIVQAVFSLLSNNPDFTPANRSGLGEPLLAVGYVVFDDKIDPFDAKSMADANLSLTRFGFCLMLEKYTFDRSTKNAISINQYCNDPGRMGEYHRSPASNAVARQRRFVPKPKNGIFYRPRGSYQLSVFVRHLPDKRIDWRLGLLKQFNLENIMPVISVGIDRAVFATRRTGLVFDDGVLKKVCISKGSEGLAGVEIVLDVVYGIIALPSEIIRATYVDVETTNKLIAAETKLIKAQNDYIKFLENEGSEAKLGGLSEQPVALSLDLDSAKNQRDTQNSRFNSPSADGGAIYTKEADKRDALAEICSELMSASASTHRDVF